MLDQEQQIFDALPDVFWVKEICASKPRSQLYAKKWLKEGRIVRHYHTPRAILVRYKKVP